ncbi:MAG TPA: bifunctional oligoribonuclease/PAP phosphatase NrnA [Chthoniobacteraceae bacterium]
MSEIADVLREKRTFAVFSHARPDGDALGCTLAVTLCLQQLGKEVVAWNEDGMLEKLRHLPGSNLVLKPPAIAQRFDAVIVLDNAVKNRAGSCIAAVESTPIWVNIDHHITNERYGDLQYVDPAAPATGQILYELFTQCELPLTYEMADNLFAAISTDTGSFQYPSTTARTFEIGAKLIKAGVKVGELSQRLYESYPRRRLELLRSLLNELRFTSQDRVASFALTAETVRRIGAAPEDNEGLIDTIRAVEGVIVAAFFEELVDGKVRISLRSKSPKLDVSKVCGEFGGGGHTLAAGARASGTLAEVQERVLATIDRQFTNG